MNINKYIGLAFMTPMIVVIVGELLWFLLPQAKSRKESDARDKAISSMSAALTLTIWGIIIFFDLLK